MILKYAITHNHPQPLKTTHNYSQLSTTTHNPPHLLTTTHNHPQPPKKPSTTTHNQPQLPTTIYNHPQQLKKPHTTIHNYPKNYPQPSTTIHNPKIIQKSQDLSQIVMLLHFRCSYWNRRWVLIVIWSNSIYIFKMLSKLVF